MGEQPTNTVKDVPLRTLRLPVTASVMPAGFRGALRLAAPCGAFHEADYPT